MRISVEKQAFDFLKLSKEKNLSVFKKNDIKRTVRDFLTTKGVLFSPYDWIYLKKKTTDTKDIIIKNNIYWILSLIWWVITWEFVMNYYLWKNKNIKEFIILKPNQNFITYLWDKKSIKLNIKISTINRITENIKYEWYNLEIESPLSFIVNNINKLSNDKTFIEFVLARNFESVDIINWLLNKYKISWLSKLAIFYKNYKRKWQYLTIKNSLEQSWKKLDRRKNKVNIIKEQKIKTKKEILSIDELI